MIVPMYMSEVSTPGIRGTLVVLQQCKSNDSFLEKLGCEMLMECLQ